MRAANVKHNVAFTLIEVLVSLVILAVAVVSLIELQVRSIRVSDRAIRQSQAVLLASQKVADALANSDSSSRGETAGDGAGPEMTYNVSMIPVESADLQGVDVSGLKNITVEVTWLDGQQERKVRMVSYVPERTANETVSK